MAVYKKKHVYILRSTMFTSLGLIYAMRSRYGGGLAASGIANLLIISTSQLVVGVYENKILGDARGALLMDTYTLISISSKNSLFTCHIMLSLFYL
jgi:hypothetical protein